MNTNGVVLRPVAEGEAVPVAGDLLIGRDAECDLVLAGGAVSRKHARLSLQDGTPWLEDLGSSNGTYVNEHRIGERVKLNNGDRLRFDIVEFDLIVQTPPSDATQVRASTVVRPAVVGEPRSAPQAPPGPQDAQPAPAAEHPRPGGSDESAPEAQRPERGQGPDEHRTEPPPPVAPSKPEVEAAVANETRTKRAPGAWAFDDKGAGGKTQLLGADELKQLLSQAAVPGQRTDINQPYLQVVSGKLSGKYLRLQGDRQTNVWTVGSDPARDIVLDDAGVSSFHAQLKNEASRWKLVDQMSANGTYVNGTKATASFLSSGDRLRFGSVECVFHLPGARPGKAGSRRSTWLIAAASFAVTAALLFLLWGWLD